MPQKDKRIDAYIARAAPFAQPVLKRMRSLVHKGCPGVTETIKWGMPAFDYHGPLFSMAAFKAHCVGGFWKRALLDDPKGYLAAGKNSGGAAMGNLGRMTSVKDLPPDTAFTAFIRQHARLNEDGVSVPKATRPKKALVLPHSLSAALQKDKLAASVFESFSPSHRREYAEWVAEAKTEATRARRVQTTLSWLRAKKTRNWKYQRRG